MAQGQGGFEKYGKIVANADLSELASIWAHSASWVS
jgi:hypothetical protein